MRQMVSAKVFALRYRYVWFGIRIFFKTIRKFFGYRWFSCFMARFRCLAVVASRARNTIDGMLSIRKTIGFTRSRQRFSGFIGSGPQMMVLISRWPPRASRRLMSGAFLSARHRMGQVIFGEPYEELLCLAAVEGLLLVCVYPIGIAHFLWGSIPFPSHVRDVATFLTTVSAHLLLVTGDLHSI